MAIEVRHDESVVLRLPLHVPEAEGAQFVAQRARWITQCQTEMRSRAHGRLEIRLENGGTMPWLGEQRSIELKSGIEPALMDDGSMLLPAPHEASMDMQEHCIKLGLERLIDREGPAYMLARLSELSRRTGLAGSSVVLRNYRSRWGSCSQSGSLTLNRRLMLCRPEVIDYVIIHELCHLVHLNHSKRFWQLVERHCPGWRRQRDWLKLNTGLLDF
jgi:predicted metal-dependent hydrolase